MQLSIWKHNIQFALKHILLKLYFCNKYSFYSSDFAKVSSWRDFFSPHFISSRTIPWSLNMTCRLAAMNMWTNDCQIYMTHCCAQITQGDKQTEQENTITCNFIINLQKNPPKHTGNEQQLLIIIIIERSLNPKLKMDN